MKIVRAATYAMVGSLTCIHPAIAAVTQKEVSKLIETAKTSGRMHTARISDLKPNPAAVSGCVDAWRPMLRDPDSAKAVDAYVRIRVNGERSPPKIFRQVIIDGRAKNGFGGYDYMVMGCDLNTNGSVDRESAKLHELLIRLNKDDWLKETD